MTLPQLKLLWLACATLVLSAGLFLAGLHSCERFAAPPQESTSWPPPVSAPPASPPAPLGQRLYTFVGPAKPDKNLPHDTSAVHRAGETSRSNSPHPTSASAAADTLLPLGRQDPTAAGLGLIPDLDIRLAGADLRQIMHRYGYVPAIKTRSRLLGKIAGGRFVPLTPAELSQYARRGRSGADHPEAGPWLRRVATELHIPLADVQFIFLVPLATEEIFIAAENAALQRAGQSAADVALVQAHFDANLAVVVDALIDKTGKIIRLDSLSHP